MLIAQSLVATLTSTNPSQLLLSLIDKMSGVHQNQLHGLLLMVINVVMESIAMAQEREEQPLAAGGEEVLACLLKKNHIGKRLVVKIMETICYLCSIGVTTVQ